jgi:hypothetical protein
MPPPTSFEQQKLSGNLHKISTLLNAVHKTVSLFHIQFLKMEMPAYNRIFTHLNARFTDEE